MIWMLAVAVLLAMLVVMVAAWAFCLAVRNGGWTDVFWTFGSGVTMAMAALIPLSPGATPAPQQWLVCGMVLLWMIRLGLYLAPRVATLPEDARYARFRAEWGRTFPLKMLWVTLPQAPATALLSLSVLAAARRPEPTLDRRDWVGVAILIVALAGEALADSQMRRFRTDPARRGKVMSDGLWAWSRHPNYFFQWLGWLAYPAMVFDPARPISWVSFAGPLVMYALLRHVSGVPPLEDAMLRSRGEAFRSYQARVSVFFPWPPKASPSRVSPTP